MLAPGSRAIEVFAMTDFFGVEIDLVSLDPVPVARPLEVKTVTVYGVALAVVPAPDEAVAALWESEQLGLRHSRFGFADAFNLEIADALVPDCAHPEEARVLRADGFWSNPPASPSITGRR